MKKIFLLTIASLCIITANAQSKEETEVAHAIDALKQAMVNADSSALNMLVADDLSYGHSGGKIEDKATFIRAIVSGQSDFVTIDLSNQTIKLYEHTAVVRHSFNATTNDNGKTGTVVLSILTVWNKHHDQWQLIARQAVRIQ